MDCPLVVALLGCSLAVMEKPRRKPHSHIGDTLSKSPVMDFVCSMHELDFILESLQHFVDINKHSSEHGIR
mgnify:CR=1 FL=1